MDQIIENRRAKHGRGVKFLARDGCTNHGKDAGTDDRPNAQCGKRNRPEGFLEGVLGLLGRKDELVDRFGAEDLPGQRWLLKRES